MNILLWVGRGIEGNGSDSLIRSISALKWCNPTSVTLFTFNKTDTGAKYIAELSGVKIANSIRYNDEYERDCRPKKYSTWLEFVDKVDWIPTTAKFDAIFVYGGILSEASKMKRDFAGEYDKIISKQSYMNFMSVGHIIGAQLQLIKTANRLGIRIHELSFDPQEHSFDMIKTYPPKDHRLYHGYDIPSYNAHRVDTLTNYMALTQGGTVSSLFDSDDKEYDLVFGCSISAKCRVHLRDKLKVMESSLSTAKVKFFIADNEMDIDTTVPRAEYLKYVEKSRFTLLVPAYDIKCFSVYRFQESLAVKTLPLIGSDVFADDFAASFNIPPEIIAELRYDYSALPNISEARRLELIDILSPLVLNVSRKFQL